MFVSSHDGSRVKLSLCRSVDRFLDLPRQFGRVLTSKEHNWCDVLPVGQGGSTLIKRLQIRMAGISFCRGIEITQNETRAPKRKPQAFESGLNEMADARLALRVRGKIGDKCSVRRLRFAVVREFCF